MIAYIYVCSVYSESMTKEQSLLYKAGVFALLAIGVLALAAIWIMFSQNNQSNSRQLPVEGKAEVSVVPNKATLSVTFEEEGKTQQEASDKLAQKLTNLSTTLDKEGVKIEDRKTENLSVAPKYEQCIYNPVSPTPCPAEPKIIGYTANQTMTIKMKIENGDKSKLEKLSGLIPAIGAKYTNGPSLEVDNKEAVNQARAEAIADAKAKAEATAKALGLRLGKIMYYSENSGGSPMPYYSARAEMVTDMKLQAAAPVQVELGTDKVSMTVSVTYEVE
jgi:uncharacterized protein YggE